MADIASLPPFEVKSDQVKGATAALRDLPKVASAAERAAEKWGMATKEAGRLSEEFSKRVRKTIQDLEFERQQLARNATEQARFAALRRAGVSALSAEGQAISASVQALQAQRAALGQTSVATKAWGAAWGQVKGILAGFGIAAIAGYLIDFAKATFEAASGLDELASQLGTTAENLQALQYQATQNGVKMEQLEGAIGKFSQKMGEAAEGSKPMIEALNQLGVKNLDAQGKLRPTEDLMTEVAIAITAIEDPARKAAAAVDFFGKAGMKMLPMLAEMAKGSDAMAAAAKRAGTVMSAETIAALDKVADKMAENKLKNQKVMAEQMADLWAAKESFNKWALDTIALFAKWGDDLVASVEGTLRPISEGMAVEAARAVGGFIAAFSVVPDQLGMVFTNAWASAKRASIIGLNDLSTYIASTKVGQFLGFTGGQIEVPAPTGPSGASWQGAIDAIKKAGEEAAKAQEEVNRRAREAAAAARAEEKSAQLRSLDAQRKAEERNAAAAAANRTKGAGTSTVKGAGKEAEDAEKKYQKLMDTLGLTAAAQDKMTEASGRGETAYAEVKIQLEAQQKALEIYGKVLDLTHPKVKAIADLLTRIAQGKAAEAFNVGTIELKKQNEILEAQIRLMNEAPAIQEREIALIKLKQEAEKGGIAITKEAIEARKEAINQNEKLKTQQEELRKAQEMWTAPLKTALQGIESAATDAFEKILETGKINFAELGNVFKKIIIRMIAEFMTLALVRPVMNVIVNTISPGSADQMGVGMPGGSTGGGGMSMPSMSSISNMLGKNSDIAQWLNTPMTGPYAGISPAGMEGVPMLTGSAGAGITPMQGIGAGIGIGIGAYNLSQAKTTGQTIAGIGQIAGSIISLLPIPGAQIIGPIISMLASMAPSILGDEKQVITNQEYGSIAYGPKGFTTAGGAWGPTADAKNLQGPLGQVGKTMDSIYKAFGGVKDAGKVWGLALESISQAKEGEQGFQGQTSYVISPTGVKKQWGMGSTPEDIGLEAAGVSATLESILSGAIGDISENMRKALLTVNESGKDTFETLANVVGEIKIFDAILDNLGKTATGAEVALKEIDAQFQSLTDTAEKYGLDVTKIDKEHAKSRLKVATDLGEGIQRALDDMVDPMKGLLADLDKEKEGAIAANKYIVENVVGAVDQINKIEELYGKKRVLIVENNTKALETTEQDMNAFWARSQHLFVAGKELEAVLKGMADEMDALSDPMGAQIKSWQEGMVGFVKGVGDTFGVGSAEYGQATIAAYKRYNAQLKAANDDFVEGMNDMYRAMQSPSANAIENLMQERAAAITKAMALDGPMFDAILHVGPALEAAMRAMNARVFKAADDFKFSITQGLLEFTNPLQAAINVNNKARDEALITAEANNAAIDQIGDEMQARLDRVDNIRIGNRMEIRRIENEAVEQNRALTEIESERVRSLSEEADLAKRVGDQVSGELGDIGRHYVSLADVTEYYLKKEADLKKQYYAQTIAGLQELIRRVTYGDLSGASAVTAFTGSQASFKALRDRAFAGDRDALAEFSEGASAFLVAARDFFAYTPEYFKLRDQVKKDAEELDRIIMAGNVPGQEGPPDYMKLINELLGRPAETTNKVSSEIEALIKQVERLMAANDDKQRTIDQMLQENSTTNSLLQRLVVNM